MTTHPFETEKVRRNHVFGHRMMKIGHPVRSAIHNHHIVQLVLQWVTMRESWIPNSFAIFSAQLE
jgi:hypothetical protein